MENQQNLKMYFSFRNATMMVCFFNLITALLLIRGFLSASNRTLSGHGSDSAQLRYIKEAEEARRALEPVDLIKRIREIQEEAKTDPETIVQVKAPTKFAAVDLSKRLQDFRALNDANSKKALEEWRKRKMERARIRELEKNATTTTV